MHARIKKVGLANGVKSKGNVYTLPDMIQESYKVSYEAKRLNNKLLINLTESHLANIKQDPTNVTLCEDLDVLQGLVKLGKDQTLKDVEEAETPKKRRRRSVNSSVKPATEFKESWVRSKKSITAALNSFRESAKTKVFYKELDKFNKSISRKSPITMTEAVKLYKASNSCLTHLTVELEKNPSFLKSYRECTRLLSRDNLKLLESIQEGKTPSKALIESFVVFSNILLESNTPDELDPEIYEDADLEELEDRDVINEDADMEELDDRDVIAEDADLEELDDRDVINEDADMEELDDRDVINEEEEVDELEDEPIEEDADLEELDDRDVINEEEEIGNDSVSIDLTPEEINLLKSILGKISSMQEADELVDDEVPAPVLIEDEEEDLLPSDDVDPEEIPEEDIDEEDEEEIPVEDASEDFDENDEEDEDALETEDDIEDIDEEDEEEIPEEDEEEIPEEDPIDSLENARKIVNEVIDDLENDIPSEEDNTLDFELSESAINRIKKCF